MIYMSGNWVLEQGVASQGFLLTEAMDAEGIKYSFSSYSEIRQMVGRDIPANYVLLDTGFDRGIAEYIRGVEGAKVILANFSRSPDLDDFVDASIDVTGKPEVMRKRVRELNK